MDLVRDSKNVLLEGKNDDQPQKEDENVEQQEGKERRKCCYAEIIEYEDLDGEEEQEVLYCDKDAGIAQLTDELVDKLGYLDISCGSDQGLEGRLCDMHHILIQMAIYPISSDIVNLGSPSIRTLKDFCEEYDLDVSSSDEESYITAVSRKLHDLSNSRKLKKAVSLLIANHNRDFTYQHRE